jgi:hypothetical protein
MGDAYPAAEGASLEGMDGIEDTDAYGPGPGMGVGVGVGEGDVGRGYFRILERAHEGSRPPSPGSIGDRARTRSGSRTPARSAGLGAGAGAGAGVEDEDDVLDEEDLPARGYYERFFREEGRLGMGAEGSVYLATHVIGGSVLGEFYYVRTGHIP